MTYENKFIYEKTCMPKCPKNVNIKNIGGIIPGLTLPIKKNKCYGICFPKTHPVKFILF